MYAIPSSLNTDYPIMLLNQPIGFSADDPGAPYIDGALFQQELLELDNKGYKAIRIYINSPGGNVIEGYNICNAILKSNTPVDTYNVGIAASMAGIIWMTGRKRVMADYASLMIHNPFGSSDKKMLNALRQSTVTILASKCKMTEEEVSYVMMRETWFLSAECLEKGFATEIEVTSESNQKRMPLASVRAAWKEANIIQNNLFNLPNSNTVMETIPSAKVIGTSLIAAYLELNVDATENAVLNAVKGRVNTEVLAREKAETDVKTANKEITKVKEELEAITAKYNKLVADNKVATEAAEAQAKKDAEAVKASAETALRAEIKTIVSAYADPKSGRIKSDSVEKWIETGVSVGKEKVKELLEALPLSRVAPGSIQAAAKKDITTGEITVDPHEVPANAMSYQARIMANVKARAAVK